MSAATQFAFVDSALDRADKVRTDASALAALQPDALCIPVDPSGRTPVDRDGQPAWPRGATADEVFLGLAGEVAYFAHALPDALPEAASIDLRQAATLWPAREATAFAQARAVLHWRSQHRFCARCGAPLTFSRAGWQGDCAACGATHYPRTDPAVIVAVTDGQNLLLGRHPSWPEGRYSTLAGFVEPGETLEAAVRREVMEETGVTVGECRYLASQPWPFPGSLMLGFIADAAYAIPEVDGVELEDAQWFSRSTIAAALDDAPGCTLKLSPRLSISRWLIEQWAAGVQTHSA